MNIDTSYDENINESIVKGIFRMKLIYYFEIRIYLILGTCLPYFSGLFHLFDPQNVLVA